ncbi:MAG: pseudouridine synthase [Alphaproteobacteria bacterium]|nr:pseudouridine synthase [Alphaproteobacteria bacterium]
MKPQRIAKMMAAAGLCSRREAERWIEEGRVMVNGETLTTPATLVGAGDDVIVDGKRIAGAAPIPRLFVYHKPAGLVTSHRDEEGRATVFDHLPRDLPRVISVGRLDLDSEGLLLLTTSGALARAMELPSGAQARTYRVRIRGTPMETHYQQLERGVTIDGVHYQPIDAVPDRAKEGRNQWLTLTLHEGKNREIRRIFEHFDIPVSRLIRIQYGNFHLDDLAPGEVAEVPRAYVEELMEKLGVA